MAAAGSSVEVVWKAVTGPVEHERTEIKKLQKSVMKTLLGGEVVGEC